MKRRTLVKYALGIVASAALLGATEVRANRLPTASSVSMFPLIKVISHGRALKVGVAWAFARATEGSASNDSHFAGN